MPPKAVKAPKRRHYFPHANMKRLSLRVLNGELDKQKEDLKSAIHAEYDNNEGANAYAAIKQVGFEPGMGRGLSRIIKSTQNYLDKLSSNPDDETVSKIYKSLMIQEPDGALSKKISDLRITLAERQSKALTEQGLVVTIRTKYESLFEEYSKARSEAIKGWKHKYSELVKKLKESRDGNPRLHELRAAKKASSDSDEKRRLQDEIRTLTKSLDDEFNASLISVDVISRVLSVSVDEAKRLVPVFELRKKISDINDGSVRVSHTDHLLSCIAEREVLELASCTRAAFSARVASGGPARPTLDDLITGMDSSKDAVSAFFKSSPSCRRLLLRTEVVFCEESKLLKSFVSNTSKTVLEGLTSDVLLTMSGIVYDSIVGLVKLFKTDAKTVSKNTVKNVIRTVLTSHGFESSVFDSLVDEAFTVKQLKAKQ